MNENEMITPAELRVVALIMLVIGFVLGAWMSMCSKLFVSAYLLKSAAMSATISC